MQNHQKGLFVTISGPSGVGKGTIMNMLKQRFPEGIYVLSNTTRDPRPGEKDGEQYHFVSKDFFEGAIAKGELLEYAQVHHGAYYGVLKKPVLEALEAGRVVIRELDVQGVRLVKKEIPAEQLLTIFIEPEDVEILRSRIERRSVLAPEEVDRRLASAREEIAAGAEFDVVIINRDGHLEKCFAEVLAAIKARIA